jgi:hypothetical protein
MSLHVSEALTRYVEDMMDHVRKNKRFFDWAQSYISQVVQKQWLYTLAAACDCICLTYFYSKKYTLKTNLTIFSLSADITNVQKLSFCVHFAHEKKLKVGYFSKTAEIFSTPPKDPICRKNKLVQDLFEFLKYLGYIVQSQHRAYITLRIFRLHMLCNLTFHQYLCICTYILTYFSCNYHLRVRWKFPLSFWHPLVRKSGARGRRRRHHRRPTGQPVVGCNDLHGMWFMNCALRSVTTMERKDCV